MKKYSLGLYEKAMPESSVNGKRNWRLQKVPDMILWRSV